MVVRDLIAVDPNDIDIQNGAIDSTDVKNPEVAQEDKCITSGEQTEEQNTELWIVCSSLSQIIVIV